MNSFENFEKKLFQELNKELPGFSAQKLMAPLGRRPPIEYLKENISPRNSAVLILIYPDKETRVPTLIFIERADTEGRVHSGQIAFPGGGYDEKADKSFIETALRETEEEIGVQINEISIIGALTSLYIPVSNYMVYPFIGTVKAKPYFAVHDREVKNIIEIELDELFSPKNKSKTIRHIKIRNQDMEVPCYAINEKIIWGATAMILAEFEEIVKKTK